MLASKANNKMHATRGPRRELLRDRILFYLFLVPFVLVMLVNIAALVRIAMAPFDLDFSYALTEWLINYSAGFVRRGLPGSVIFLTASTAKIPPQLVVVLVAVILYAMLFVFLWKVSNGVLPRWAILAAPLLGYPAYVDDILIRKDVFILLVFSALLAMALRSRYAPVWMLPSALVFSIGMLSHELLIFLGLPLLIVLEAILCFGNWCSSESLPRSRHSPRASRIWYVVSVLIIASSTFFVVIHGGTAAQARVIASSWDRFLSSPPLAEVPGGAIGWIGRAPQAFIEQTKGAFNGDLYGVSAWLPVVLMSALGVFWLAAAMGQRSHRRAAVFLVVSGFQFIAMLPLIYIAVDTGRWVILCLFSSTIFVCLLRNDEVSWLHGSLSRFCRFPDLKIPWIIPPLGLAFWGMPIGPWMGGAGGWLAYMPIAFPFKLYYYLRMAGMPSLGHLVNLPSVASIVPAMYLPVLS